MVSPKIFILATLLLVSEGQRQFSGLPQGCGADLRPTGPIIPAARFVLPAMIKTCLPCSQPGPTTPVAPVAPVTPVTPVTPVSQGVPCFDIDDEYPCEDLLLTLITTFLDSKNSGKKVGKKGKGYDEDEYEYSSPSLYTPAQAPCPAADAPGVPELNIIFRPMLDACAD